MERLFLFYNFANSASSIFRNSLKVSPLKPNLNVSNGITSAGAMLPRLTFGPNNLINQICCDFCGASQRIFSPGTLVMISSIKSL